MSSPGDLQRLLGLELDDADVQLLVVEHGDGVLVGRVKDLLNRLVERPLDDSLGRVVVSC